MEIKLIGELQTIMSNFGSKHCKFAWPTVARMKNGRIAVAASGYRRRHVCPFGKTVLSISENEGETYTVPAPVIDTVLDDRDGGLCPFGESGLIVTSFNISNERMREYTKTYTDNDWEDWDTQAKEIGAYAMAYMDTVTQEEEDEVLGVTYKVSYDNGVTFGPLMKSPVSSPHGPIELQNGEILWVGSVNNNCHDLEAHIMNLEDGTTEKVGEFEFVDLGASTENCEPYTVQLPDGTLITHIRVQPEFTMLQSISKDNGRTWTKPVRLFEDQEGAPGHILVHSSGALIGTYSHRKDPRAIRVMISFDNGETWDYGHDIYTIHNQVVDLGYPSTVELKDGTLATVFYSQYDDMTPSVILQQKWTFEK